MDPNNNNKKIVGPLLHGQSLHLSLSLLKPNRVYDETVQFSFLAIMLTYILRVFGYRLFC